MKSIAFLFCFIVFMVSGIQAEAFRDKTFTVNDTNIFTTRDEEGHLTITIDLDEPLLFTLGDETKKYYANDAAYDGEHYFIYGFLHDEEASTFYDAFIFGVDTEGNSICNHIFDFAMLEETVDVFQLGETWIFHIERSTVADRSYEHVANHFIVFDEDFETYEMAIIEPKIVRKYIEDDRIYFSDEYHGPFHSSLTENLSVIFPDTILGVAHDEAYTGSVEITVFEAIEFENDTHFRTLYIDYPGHYTLTHAGQTLQFTVHPEINGVIPNEAKEGVYTITLSSGTTFLNQDIYSEGTPIYEIGHHELTITGHNNYMKTIPFTVNASVEGVVHESVYTEPRAIHFSGVGHLNGVLIESGHTVTENGAYELLITGVNGYEKSVEFVLDISMDTSTAGTDYLAIIEIGLISIAVMLGGVLIYKLKIK